MLLRFLSSFIIKSFWVWFFFLLLIFFSLNTSQGTFAIFFHHFLHRRLLIFALLFFALSRDTFSAEALTRKRNAKHKLANFAFAAKKNNRYTRDMNETLSFQKTHSLGSCFEKGDDFWVSFGVEFFNVTCDRREKWFILFSVCCAFTSSLCHGIMLARLFQTKGVVKTHLTTCVKFVVGNYVLTFSNLLNGGMTTN